MAKKCLICGKGLRGYPSRVAIAKYCSTKCCAISLKGKIPKSAWKKGEIENEKKPGWKGEDALYLTKHKWVTRKKGNIRKCEHCGTTREKVYHWANIDHKYRRNLDDYMRLCTSCHWKYDKQFLGVIHSGNGSNQYKKKPKH